MHDIQDKLNRAKTLVGQGKLSRRDFIELAVIAGISATAAEAMFTSAARAQPKRGGSARFGLAHGATTETLDPVGYPDTFAQTVFWGAMGNSLTEVDTKGNITGDLAESFEHADSAKTWAFRLRKGITFHDG